MLEFLLSLRFPLHFHLTSKGKRGEEKEEEEGSMRQTLEERMTE